ncbi:MAG: hypothetical protein HZA50_18040 [Planctomycetes bacterium]|nr:hypothetical protein [Planctomycetota bacterium]
MKTTYLAPALFALLAAGSAWGQELELRDKVSLEEKANAGACFTPDGKKILLANTDNDKESISYRLIGIDGKDKKQVYKFNLGQLKQYRPQEAYNMFNNRQEIFSADGSLFLTCPDLDKDENARFLWVGIPVVSSGMDGKTTLVRRPDQAQQSAPNYLGGMLIINGVFGKEDEVYYAILDRATQNENGLTGSSKIMKFDMKTEKAKTLANMDVVVGPIIFISPDRSRLAGIVFQMERDNVNNYRQAIKLWAYDIPSGKISYSMPISENMNNTMPAIAWSQDNSTIYAVMTGRGVQGSLKVFRPFLAPQKPDEEEAKKLKALAVQLGDEDYQQRDAASAQLQAAGSKAADILDAAVKSPDPEIAMRAKKLVAELTGKVISILERRTIESFIEVAPGFLCVKNANSSSMTIVEVATKKSKTILGEEKLVLIDKNGDLGLFRDLKDQSLWTAKIVFTAAESQPATQSSSNPAASNN